MLEVDAPTTCKWLFLFAFLQTVQNIFSFPQHSVIMKILSSILDEIFILVLFSVALHPLRRPFSDFPAHGPGMYMLQLIFGFS